MRAVVQRVREASVTVNDHVCGEIGPGLLVYLGVAVDDGQNDAAYLADKVMNLRIFPDAKEKLNLSVADARGAALVVSAFTVQADARRGRRPSFESAANPAHALAMYESFCDTLAKGGLIVARGAFGEMMDVKSVNAGPVCILLDSRRGF